MVKINIYTFTKAVENSAGVITLIAQKLNCSRTAIYDFMDKNPEAAKLVDDEKEKIIDIAEKNLIQDLQRGEEWATKYTLNTVRGRKRGYGDQSQQQVNVNTNGQTNVTFHDLILHARNKSWKSEEIL